MAARFPGFIPPRCAPASSPLTSLRRLPELGYRLALFVEELINWDFITALWISNTMQDLPRSARQFQEVCE
uniref:Uncharacterized protein n=1 Tax=Leersia perrieri TaxID=77586 RepID=A0A0D9XZE1_9ORYZ